jgi:hypothetical protein
VRRRLAIVVALSFALSGCGDSEDEDGGPAALAPADSLVYLEEVLRPQGEERQQVESIAALFGVDDPGERIVAELDRAFAGGRAQISFEEDIGPWLGERGAFFLSGLPDGFDGEGKGESAFPGGGSDGGILLEATDAESAAEFIDKVADEEQLTERSEFEDVDYRLGKNGQAAAVMDEFVFFGSEQGLRDAISAGHGAESLAEAGAAEPALARLGSDPLAWSWVDAAAVVDHARQEGEISPEQIQGLESAYPGLLSSPIAAAAFGEGGGIAIEYLTGAGEEGAARSSDAASKLLETLPGDSWLAAAADPAALGRYLEHGGRIEGLSNRVERALGVPLDRLTGSLDGLAVFARGSGIFAAGGGLVVETADPRALVRVVRRAGRTLSQRGHARVSPLRLESVDGAGISVALPDAPGLIHAFVSGDRMVVAYGDESAEAAVEGSGPLRKDDGFALARRVLGRDYRPSLYVAFGPIADLIGGFPILPGEVTAAVDLIEGLGFLIAGSRVEGDHRLIRIVLRPAAEGTSS